MIEVTLNTPKIFPCFAMRSSDLNQSPPWRILHLAWRKALLVQLSIGAVLIVIGILVHAGALDLIASRVRVVVDPHR
jgi:hypothetical protein